VSVSEFESLKIEYVDRIKHVYSEYRTNDEELNFAQTVTESAETIVIKTDAEETGVIVFTEQAVYHFRTFRADYLGHASRTLVSLLYHFRINVPIEFILSHQSLTIYLSGNKIVAGEEEYPIELRENLFEMVEPVQWMMSSTVLDMVIRLANDYEIEPIEVVESAIKLIAERKMEQEIGVTKEE